MNGVLGPLSRDSVLRVLRDLLADELRRSRGPSWDPAPLYHQNLDKGPGVDLSPAGVGADSLERFVFAARINDLFAVHATGLEDNLLRGRTLHDLADVVCASLKESFQQVAFASGGTVASPKIWSHRIQDLAEEVRELAAILAPQGRVIVTVPVHHIYGFIFGVLLPEYLGATTVDARMSLLAGSAGPRWGDLVVAVPFFWEHLRNIQHTWEPGYIGVSSTAPLPEELSTAMAEWGAGRLVEVYGSTETSGIAWCNLRNLEERAPGEFRGFTLFPWWDRSTNDTIVRRRGHGTPPVEPITLPDEVTWRDSRTLVPRRRRDAVVQVGGHNVDLLWLRDEICRIAAVPDCAVRLNEGRRVKAFLVGDHLAPEERRLREKALADALPDHARPAEIIWGAEVPRTPLGKLADFSSAR